MRRRLIVAIVAVAAATLALFALPLAVVLRDGYRDQELLRLQRDAVAAAREIDLGTTASDPVELPAGPDRFAVYDDAGNRVAGRPAAGLSRADALVRDAIRRARPTTRIRSGVLLAAVPLLSGERVTGAIRVQRSDAVVDDRTQNAWLALAGAAAGVLLLATLAAILLGRRLARPLERVAVAAARLGDGDFSVRAPRGDIREVDAVAEALDQTATRLETLIARERAFSSDASHQLRTPLAALRLELEALQLGTRHPAELKRALIEVDRLQQTIDTLLAVARDHPRPDVNCDLVTLLTATEQRWRGPLAVDARRLTLSLPGAAIAVHADERIVGEILDVLLDNAVRHGAGPVNIALRTIDEHWAEVAVSDAGPGFAMDVQTAFERRSASADGHGIGLALARALAHAEGGRLAITNTGPAPRISLVLMRSPDPGGSPVAC
jgi:signal transduction histidine kinase